MKIGTEKIFSFIENIREINLLVPVIIMSNYDMYVLDSVKYNIFDFIRKSKLDEELYDTLDRLLNYLKSALPYIVFKNDDVLKKLQIKDIVYVQLSSHQTTIYSQNECYVVNSDYHLIFKDCCDYLIQIHRSYYINPYYLILLKTNQVILSNNIYLPIGKKYKKIIMNYYMQKIINIK